MIEELLKSPELFEFFQAVRLIERAAACDSTGPRSVVGSDDNPRHERLRFTAETSRTFPNHEISRSSRRSTELASITEIVVTFLGLTGPSGILPHSYSSLLLSRLRERDHVLRDFLDLFHHRTISLFYRAWEKYRFPINYERSRYDTRHVDLFTRGLVSLTGCETAPVSRRSSLSNETFLYYAGLFSSRHRTASDLERVLGDFLAIPVQVDQFVGRWQTLLSEDRTRLPSRAGNDGQYHQLGQDAAIGERTWDVQGRFRVKLGPVNYDTFASYLPPGDAIRPAVQLTRAYVGAEFDFDVQLILERSEVPRCQLGVAGGQGARLGWDAWLQTRPFERHADDSVFSVSDQSLNAASPVGVSDD